MFTVFVVRPTRHVQVYTGNYEKFPKFKTKQKSFNDNKYSNENERKSLNFKY